MAEAESLYKRSLAIREKTLGPDDPALADDLSMVAGHLGYREYAEELYRRSLAINEKAFGPNHFRVAACLDDLARLLRATKREKEAGEFEARAARIRAIKR